METSGRPRDRRRTGEEIDHRDGQIAGRGPRRRRGRPGGGAPASRLRRPRRGVQPGHPGRVQVSLGQVDGVGEQTGSPDPPGGARPRRRLPDRQGRGGLQAGDAPGRAGGDRLRPQGRGTGQPDGGRGGRHDHEGVEPDAGERAAPGSGTDQGPPRRDPGGGVPAAARTGRHDSRRRSTRGDGGWWTSPWRR